MGARRASEPHNGNGLDVESRKRTQPSTKGNPRCAAVADAIVSSRDFANFMSALVGDIVTGRIGVREANAACNAGGKLLKIVELEHKYGRKVAATQPAAPLSLAQAAS